MKLVNKVFAPPSLRLNTTAFVEVVLILSVLLAVLFYFSRKTLRQEATWDAEQTLEATVQHIDNVLLSVEQSAGNVYWDLVSHLDEPDRMEAYCRSLVECNENIMGCAIGFKPGYYPGQEQFVRFVHRRQYDSNELVTLEATGNKPYTIQKWYDETMQTGRTSWIDNRKDDAADGESVISFCLPILEQTSEERGESTEGSVVGVLAVDVSIDLFSQIVLSAKPSPNSYSILLDNKGAFIVHPDPEILANHILTTLEKTGADPAAIKAGKAMIAGETGNMAFRKDGKNLHVFYKPFVRTNIPGRALEDLDWSVGIIFPDDDVFGNYNYALFQVLKVAVIGLLVFFVLCRMVTRRQLKALRKLTESAHRIADGDYSEQIPTSRRSDEIGQFQQHFVHMQHSLAAHVNKLEQLNTTLEERRETLRKTYEQTQADEQVKTTFLQRMSNLLLAPADAISRSVEHLCNNYSTIGLEEAGREVETIRQQSKKTQDLLHQILSSDTMHHTHPAAAIADGMPKMADEHADAEKADDSTTVRADSTPTKSLSKKLSRTLMLLAMPIFILALGSYYRHTQDLIHREAMERSSSILNTTVQRVVSYMNAIKTAARSNVWLMEENFDPDSLQSISRRIVSLNRSVLSCSVSTEPDVFPQCGRYFSVYSVNEGDTIITMREPDFEYFDKVWYKTALHTGKPCWVDPFSDFNEGTINYNDAVATFCLPLRPKTADSQQLTANGQRPIKGVVSSDFSFNHLAERILNTEHPYPGAYYMLIGTDGRYLIHPETKLLFKKTIFADADPVEHADVIALGQEMTAGQQGTMHVTFGKQLCHVSYMPIPDTQWSLALVCPDDQILANYHYLGYLMVGLMIVGLMLIWWLTYRVVKLNIKPVNQLLEATKKIAEGDYTETIPHSDRKDAIAQLQNGFAAMQQSIVAHMERIDHTAEEVRKQNAELEQALAEASEAARKKDAFVQDVLHQITTPINIIQGLASVLLNGLADQQQGKSNLDNIVQTMKQNADILKRTTMMLFENSKSITTE